MLRRINGSLYEAPEGARIEVVADSRNNNSVRVARFEYGGRVLTPEVILGLPGCSFIVETSRQQLQAVVVFDPAAPGAARYDLFEVENGVQNALDKFTLKSDQSNQIAFAVDPVALAVAASAGRPGAPVGKRPPAVRRKAAKKRPVATKAVRKTPRPAAKKAVRKAARPVARKAAKGPKTKTKKKKAVARTRKSTTASRTTRSGSTRGSSRTRR